MNLVVPFDFSDHARAAATYAAKMIQNYGGNLHLVHVLIPIEDEPDYLTVKTLQAKHNTVSEVFYFRESLRKNFGVSSSCDLVPGDIAAESIKAARRTKADFIVMGRQGNNGLKKYLFGSHTSEVLENSPVPVIVVPDKWVLRPIRNIVFVTDYNYSNISDIRDLVRIANPFNAVIHMIHFAQEHNDETKAALEDFQSLIAAYENYPFINYAEMTCDDAATRLASHIKETEPEMLVVPGQRKALVEKLSGRGPSNDFLFDADLPIMFF